ncbi:MAG: hypothetical protein HY842_17750 [Bacteroidetes bacterium]|nr:hypothetical protein [Bacteroidota bacterium]
MKKNLTPIFVLCLLYLAGCKNDPPPTSLPTPPPLPALDSVELVTTPDPYFLKKYQGTLDGKLPVEMVLVNWGDGFLSGRYWYTAKNKPIELSGELKPDLSFEITEYSKGKENGKFLGTFFSPDSLTGTWTSANGKRTMPFGLGFSAPTEDELNWAGNWHLNQVWDSGSLLIGNVSKDSFDFALSVVRGGHVGTIEARASRTGAKAVFKKKEFEDEPCELRFDLQPDHVQVEQPSSNLSCGFGARAYAGGRYERLHLVRNATLLVGTDEDAVFPTAALHDEFRKLVGDEIYKTFAFNMQIKERNVNKAGQTVIAGSVPGLFRSNEAIIVYGPGNKIWAATLDYVAGSEEPVLRYFTNDATSAGELNPDIEAWREGFKEYKVVF